MSKYNSLKLNLVTKEYSSNFISLKNLWFKYKLDSNTKCFSIWLRKGSKDLWSRIMITLYVFVRNTSFLRVLWIFFVFFIFEDCSESSSKLWRLKSVNVHKISSLTWDLGRWLEWFLFECCQDLKVEVLEGFGA